MHLSLDLTAPLFTSWTDQYVRLSLANTKPGKPLQLFINGSKCKFQYTGISTPAGAEILVRLRFEAGESKHLEFKNSAKEEMGLFHREIPLAGMTHLGSERHGVDVGPTSPFAGFGKHPMHSVVQCATLWERSELTQTNDGPLFTEYELVSTFAENRRYRIQFRCFRDDPYVEVAEFFSLGWGAKMIWTLNPQRQFTHILGRESFLQEVQPAVEPLGQERPDDLLCRLQMPVLGEYFIPNNRGWFAFYDERQPEGEMLGVLGLYGAKWEAPVANMPELYDRGGTVEWHSSLASGRRHWLLYTGPVEKGYRLPEVVLNDISGERPRHNEPYLPTRSATSQKKEVGRTPTIPPGFDGRFVFHRLNAEFNALRLDEHLDLDGSTLFDLSCAFSPGIVGDGDFHQAARLRRSSYSALNDILDKPDSWMKNSGGIPLANYRYLLEPTAQHAQALYEIVLCRFEKWVRQFQGHCMGEFDYNKSVIGFARCLRGMLISYELLRRDNALTAEQLGRLTSYFIFAARHILDEGRWPHSRTWLHPDHPESSRDFYTYGGEHKPDRLVWTNSLPNFQSDPLCALAHLSAIFKDHPSADTWNRFALDDIERQLDAYCGKSGAWQESINYALYTFSYLVITFRVLKARRQIDYFHDERVRRFAGWLCRFFGPLDKRFGSATWPAIGNSLLPQNAAHYLLCYASELSEGDPLRDQCFAVFQTVADQCIVTEHYPVVMSAMAPPGPPRQDFATPTLTSEWMDEVGVALRDRHKSVHESYLFQKIGFAKDHYEADETAFNWYAKGVPFCMDYGTYTGMVGVAGAHNVVEIPDADSLRRGYLADHLFTHSLDYTHCEVPVTLKLLWGRPRTFAEIDGKDGIADRTKTPYFYIGDKNPVGPKVWKVRKMLFVKPDYTAIFDRVHGEVPHRFNLHFTGNNIQRDGSNIIATGRFELDLLVAVHHPIEFELVTGELVPNLRPGCGSEETVTKHAQHFLRLYNRSDGIYRTIIFARERGRDVKIEMFGEYGMKIQTQEYCDYVWLNDEIIHDAQDDVRFIGRAGWVRRWANGHIHVCMVDGEALSAFGVQLAGRGPWEYRTGMTEPMSLRGVPRHIAFSERKGES